MAKIPEIRADNGDVIGIGIDGSGNIVGKNISVVINEAQNYGLTLLSASYFKEHKSTEQDLENWRNGFSFKLEAIKEKSELRRSIIDSLKIKLQRDHRLLIVGESGTSKSTILMEIMCEYFDCGYKILYNFGETEIKSGVDLVKFIEGLLKGNNKVIIAVDNVHSERTAAIFYVMDHLSNYELSKNLLFILTARLPEFDWFVNDRLNRVEESYRQPIRKFSQLSQYKYEVEPFTEKDIEEFIKAYKTPAEIVGTKETVSDLATKIFNDTNGQPIMVKFSVLGKGLKEDVEDRYYRYLINDTTSLPDLTKIQTALICSLLDIANIPITDKLLEKMDIQKYAFDLEHVLLNQYSEGLWKTIHPRWDMELLSFLYNEKNKSILSKRTEYLKKGLDYIFAVSNESITGSIIQVLFDIVTLKKIPIKIVESMVTMPQYLSSETKCGLYLFAFALAYRILQMYPQMLENCNKALLLEPENIIALNAKAVALGLLKKYDEAIECCDKIIEVGPGDAAAYATKGLALNELKKYDEALECWKKAVDIDDNYVGIWSENIHSLQGSSEYKNSNLIRILVIKLAGKGMSYAFIRMYNEALQCSNKALELESNSAWALTNKAWALNGLKRHAEALECSNKALELDQSQNNFSAWNNKAVALSGLKRHGEALECSNKALELNSKNEWGWLVKGLVFNGLKRYNEALECSNKALEFDPNNDLIHSNKAWSLSNLGKNEEALECSNKALELDSNSAWALTNKAVALSGLKRHGEALECSNKAFELDSNDIPNWYVSQKT